ncbi:MAG: ATP-dependent metallopeptidase FtsH/Yme1/Tma family protein, partial [Gammaproteobacteria bacterium]
MNETARTLVLMIVITLVLMLVFKNLSAPMVSNVPYSTFISEVKTGNVKQVTIEGNKISGKRVDD